MLFSEPINYTVESDKIVYQPNVKSRAKLSYWWLLGRNSILNFT